MENQQKSGNDQVVLILPGIDKQWVRNKKGIWVDLESLRREQVSTDQTGTEHASLEEAKLVKQKSWWQFWK